MSQQWKVLLAFTGIFVAGAVAGGIVALRVGADQAAEQIQTTAPAPQTNKGTVSPENFSLVQMKRFIDQLSLSPAQGDKIQPIITVTGDKLKKLSQESAIATKALLEDMDKQVGALLNDAQRKKLTEIQKQRQDRFNQRQNHPPSPNNGSRRGGVPGTDSHANGASGTSMEPPRSFRRGAPGDDLPQPSPTPAPADQPPVM
jgi:uncharacterized membrane protein